MNDYRIVRNIRTGQILLPRVRLCTSYWCHFVGLQFRPSLPADEGLLFVTRSESFVNSAIHMLNMFFAIGVVWLDRNGMVVDKQLAKPWRLAYAPKTPAQFYLEANIGILSVVELGDVLRFDEVSV